MGLSRRIKGAALWLLLVVIIAGGSVFAADKLQERNVRTAPAAQMQSLEPAAEREVFSDEDYRFLMEQTGLGKLAVDALKEQHLDDDISFLETLSVHQQNFFSEPEVKCSPIGIITREENTVDEMGIGVRSFEFADLKEGDVLITKSTHTLGWRHGHAGIVIDGEEGITMESLVWGMPTARQSIRKWQRYPAVIQLRLTDSDLAVTYDGREMTLGEAAAALAEDQLEEIPYGLLTGIPTKNPETLTKTQCAHLAWYPYYAFGYDIDSNGGWLVTPEDIAGSDLFEVVQVYGFDPDDLWN